MIYQSIQIDQTTLLACVFRDTSTKPHVHTPPRMLVCKAIAEKHKLLISPFSCRKPRKTTNPNRFAARAEKARMNCLDAVSAYCKSPSEPTAKVLIKTFSTLTQVEYEIELHAIELRAKILNQKGKAETKPNPRPYDVPYGILQWTTRKAIGANPALVNQVIEPKNLPKADPVPVGYCNFETFKPVDPALQYARFTANREKNTYLFLKLAMEKQS